MKDRLTPQELIDQNRRHFLKETLVILAALMYRAYLSHNSPESSTRFLVITDDHTGKDILHPPRQANEAAAPDQALLLRCLPSHYINAIYHLGDRTADGATEAENIARLTASLRPYQTAKVPVFNTTGNHEANNILPHHLSQTYSQLGFSDKPYQITEYPHCRVINANLEMHQKLAYLPEQTIDMLAHAEIDHHTIIFCHMGIVPPDTLTYYFQNNPSAAYLANGEKVEKAIHYKKPWLIGTGHLHPFEPLIKQVNGTYMASFSSFSERIPLNWFHPMVYTLMEIYDHRIIMDTYSGATLIQRKRL